VRPKGRAEITGAQGSPLSALDFVRRRRRRLARQRRGSGRVWSGCSGLAWPRPSSLGLGGRQQHAMEGAHQHVHKKDGGARDDLRPRNTGRVRESATVSQDAVRCSLGPPPTAPLITQCAPRLLLATFTPCHTGGTATAAWLALAQPSLTSALMYQFVTFRLK
jgi:hypothetical protein